MVNEQNPSTRQGEIFERCDAIDAKVNKEHEQSCPASRRADDAIEDEAWVCLSKSDEEVPRLCEKFFVEVFPRMELREVKELVRRLDVNGDQAQISSGFLSHASYPLHFLCQHCAPATEAHLLLLQALVRAYPDAAQNPDASRDRLLPLQLLCRSSQPASRFNVAMVKVLLQTFPDAAQAFHRQCLLDLKRLASSSSSSSASLPLPANRHGSPPRSAASLPSSSSSASLASSSSSSSSSRASADRDADLEVQVQVASTGTQARAGPALPTGTGSLSGLASLSLVEPERESVAADSEESLARPGPGGFSSWTGALPVDCDRETAVHVRSMIMVLIQARINLYTWANMSPFGSRKGYDSEPEEQPLAQLHPGPEDGSSWKHVGSSWKAARGLALAGPLLVRDTRDTRLASM